MNISKPITKPFMALLSIFRLSYTDFFVWYEPITKKKSSANWLQPFFYLILDETHYTNAKNKHTSWGKSSPPQLACLLITIFIAII